MKTNKNEELQSRRSFFKNAAKSALPVLGAIVLASTPVKVLASESEAATGCSYGSCAGYCYGQCGSACSNSCTYSCKGTCNNTCAGGCNTSSSNY